MKKHSVTFYDAIYHAIALTQKGLLVTADEAYYRKVKRIAHISLLKDFSL
jgi:predicted nucleic acid-binding protein